MNKRGPIVIIEDDKDDQHVIETVFKELSYPNEIVFFENAENALRFLKMPEVFPFLILSDINMPKINGFELKRRVQTDPDMSRKSIPFVFFSTAASKKSVDEAFDMAVQGFFVKPTEYQKMVSVIRNMMEYWKNCYSPSSYA